MIVTGYNCGLLIGETRLRIVHRTDVGAIEDILGGSTTPADLVGLEGVVRDVQNDGYDCERPTGYERVHISIKPDDAAPFPWLDRFRDDIWDDCIVVDLGFCERLDAVKQQKPIPTEIAFHIRFENRSQLPPEKEYEDQRVKEIAQRQAVLMEEHGELDAELIQLQSTVHGDSNSDA